MILNSCFLYVYLRTWWTCYLRYIPKNSSCNFLIFSCRLQLQSCSLDSFSSLRTQSTGTVICTISSSQFALMHSCHVFMATIESFNFVFFSWKPHLSYYASEIHNWIIPLHSPWKIQRTITVFFYSLTIWERELENIY